MGSRLISTYQIGNKVVNKKPEAPLVHKHIG
jgi:hypothetical protein